ncbi:MAG: hypothetical protein LRS43_03405 [Desulfurococcales archaeon]|nr:hypothetical protein [Desulfurococcales archaeon]
MGGRLAEFMAKYGERGYAVLKAIIEEASSNWAGFKLGDFSFKGVRSRLLQWGLEYNPSLLLARLEREYGVIETSYRSSNQHWWVIVDRRAIEEALRDYEGVGEVLGEDLRLKALKLQFYSLEPQRLLSLLRRLIKQGRLGAHDKRLLRKLAFEEIPLLVDFLEKASEYREELSSEIRLAEEIMEAAERLVTLMAGEQGHASEYAFLRGLAKSGEKSLEGEL